MRMMSDFLFFLFLGFLGYRMAAECAREALLKRVMDNKENAGKSL